PARIPTEVQLSNWDLRAVLSGFRSDAINLAGRRLMDDPNVGTIVLHRLSNVEGSSISVTSLQAPKDARRSYQNAIQDLRKDKTAEAEKQLAKAVEQYPRYAAAWYELGRLQEDRGDIPAALQSYDHAAKSDTKYISPHLRVAELRAKAEDW